MRNPLSRENIEWFVRLLRGRPLARWGTYLLIAAVALYATLPQAVLEGGLEIFGVKLNIVETPLAVFFGLLLAGCLLLVLDRVLPVLPVALPYTHPNDRQLIERIRREYAPCDRFMRDHDFGAPFKYDKLNPLDAIDHWIGARYKFIDPEVELAWNAFRAAVRKFLEEISERTVPASVPGLLTPIFDGEDSDWHTPEVMARYKVLNDTSNGVTEAWDELDALALRKLPDAVALGP
jgi:hypothetical protein